MDLIIPFNHFPLQVGLSTGLARLGKERLDLVRGDCLSLQEIGRGGGGKDASAKVELTLVLDEKAVEDEPSPLPRLGLPRFLSFFLGEVVHGVLIVKSDHGIDSGLLADFAEVGIASLVHGWGGFSGEGASHVALYVLDDEIDEFGHG